MNKEIDISKLSIEKFISKRITLKVYCEKLKMFVWFCSGKREAVEVEKLEASAITFTGRELILLLRLNPDDTFLEKLVTIKQVLNRTEFIKASFTLEGSLDALGERMDKILSKFDAVVWNEKTKEIIAKETQEQLKL